MSPTQNQGPDDESVPRMEDRATQMWIKVMWFFGVLWVLLYIFNGLKSSPTLW